MSQAAQNNDVLANAENIKILANVLKTNVSACTSIGSFYLPQIGRVFLDMLGLYRAVSGIISETVAKEGEVIPGGLTISNIHSGSSLSRLTRDQDTKNPTVEDSKEGSFETNGDLHQESRRSGVG